MYEPCLDGTPHAPGLLGRGEELGPVVVLPPSSNTVLVGVVLDQPNDALHGKREDMPVRVARLTDGLHQPLHAPVIWLLVSPRLHQKEYELVELQQGALGALERPRLCPALPVDTGDAHGARHAGALLRGRGFLRDESLEEKGGGLTALLNKLSRLLQGEQSSLETMREFYPTQGAVRGVHSQGRGGRARDLCLPFFSQGAPPSLAFLFLSLARTRLDVQKHAYQPGGI